VYQHQKLYEMAVSVKLLITGFVLVAGAMGVFAVVAGHAACRDADGHPDAISFRDVQYSIRGSETSALEAATKPGGPLHELSPDQLQTLETWCRSGAPRAALPRILEIVAATRFDPLPPGATVELLSESERNRAYRKLAALARRPQALSQLDLAWGTTLYLAVAMILFFGLGLLFSQTSLFQKTKVLGLCACFAALLLSPALLWLARDEAIFVYPLLLSALVLLVSLAVFAVVGIYDLWFRKPVA
jgi:hypothetical protein